MQCHWTVPVPDLWRGWRRELASFGERQIRVLVLPLPTIQRGEALEELRRTRTLARILDQQFDCLVDHATPLENAGQVLPRGDLVFGSASPEHFQCLGRVLSSGP